MYGKELEKLRELEKGGLFSPEFYRSRMSAGCFDSYAKFCRIPFMRKEELRSTTAMERTNMMPGEIYGIFSSSGTTGNKTFYVYSKKDKKVHEEFVKTFYTELNITPEDIGGVFAPVDTGVMAHTMMWQYTTMGAGYVNCPDPSPENMLDTVEAVPITVISTRPDILCSVASDPGYVERARASSVKKLLPGGGFLSEERRKLIENVWNADCYNMFGMSEMFGPMAGECRAKNGQHYLDKYLMIELVDPESGQPVPEGEPGVAVYTTLWDKGFPLLRYWTDDYMIIDRTPCSCGSRLPRIRCLGRMSDCIKTEKGYVFPVQLENCITKYGFYREYQAVMEKDGSLSVSIEKEQGQEIPTEMLVEIREIFGQDVEFCFPIPEELGASGHRIKFIKR